MLGFLTMLFLPFELLFDYPINCIKYHLGYDCMFAYDRKGTQSVHYFKNKSLYFKMTTFQNGFHSGMEKSWFNGDNQPHRLDGPAYESYNKLGEEKPTHKEWFLDGKRVTPMELFDSLTSEQQEAVIWNINEWK